MDLNRNSRTNKQSKQTHSKPNSAILDFFRSRNDEELERLAAELSTEAREFFDLNIHGLLGQLPDALVDTHLTMDKRSMDYILFSAMATGYITKTVEDKIKLERLWQGDDKEDTLVDRLRP